MLSIFRLTIQKQRKKHEIVFFLIFSILSLFFMCLSFIPISIAYICFLILSVILTYLVLFARCEKEPTVWQLDKRYFLKTDDKELLKLFYEKAIDMHIATDKGMYQIIGIFVPASLLVLGWVLSKNVSKKLSIEATLIIGSLAVVLVGIATLIKHRLRYYNKIREVYLWRIEHILLQKNKSLDREGLHIFMKNKDKNRFLTFHFVIDLYYFIHLFIWVITFYTKRN